MWRVIQAFFKALQLTLQGKTIAPTKPVIRYPPLERWRLDTLVLVGDVLRQAKNSGLNVEAQKDISLKLDGRMMSMDVLLGSVRHNLQTEYPMLMQADIEHHLTTLYALNLNDQYRMQTLADDKSIAKHTELQALIQSLAEKLREIPSSQGLEAENTV